MKFSKVNLIIFISLTIFLFLFLHNVFVYPVLKGYDAKRHIKYTQILIEEKRLPTWEETTQAYNPPFFYLVSGEIIHLYSMVFKKNFIDSILIWRLTGAILVLISIGIWYRIYSLFNPKKDASAAFFIIFLISLPPLYKTGAMYSTELFNLFFFSVIIYFFTCKFLREKNILNTIILSILVSLGLLTRTTFFALAGAIAVGIILDCFYKGKKLETLKILTIYFLIIFIISSWFYMGKQSGKIIDFDQFSKNIDKQYAGVPWYRRQRIAFYIDVPFKLTMHYPVRPYLSRPSYLLPIYYSDFWGDYWNFFPQTRFGLKNAEEVFKDRHFFTQARIKYLAWQNRINFILTLLMVIGFVFITLKNLLKFVRKEANFVTICELFMSSLILLTWFCFLIVLSKYPGEGDFIKASYMLFILPLYTYFTIVFLFSYIKKQKIIFPLLLLYVVITIINNLYFSFY